MNCFSHCSASALVANLMRRVAENWGLSRQCCSDTLNLSMTYVYLLDCGTTALNCSGQSFLFRTE